MFNLIREYNRVTRRLGAIANDVSAVYENMINADNSNENLLILDDIFPHLLSSFRIAEFNAYLSYFMKAEVHSTASAFQWINEKSNFIDVLETYRQYFPQLAKKVKRFSYCRNPNSRLIYTLFLHNAFTFIDYIDKHRIPFVFTLYPGGGFNIDRPDTNAKLRRIFHSPNFKKVIVTQKISRDYLLEHNHVDSNNVVFIYGGVFPSGGITKRLPEKKLFGKDKRTFDICFVAHKYTPQGVDKGYDVFIETAKILSKKHRDIFFHIVGQFDHSDIDVSDMHDRITFYGTRNTDFFARFYTGMDIIISPNAPFIITPGQFDGFPTGCCIEAGLGGVAVFCTDPLKQNIMFKDGKELVIISRDPEEIYSIIEKYYYNYDMLLNLAHNGQEAFNRVFNIEQQIADRIKILSDGFL